MLPNLLLIVFDTARADGFEIHGASPGSTPVVADLARRGRSVPTAVAPSNWTLPSHASMFTGLLPGALGLTATTGAKSGAGVNSKPILEAVRDRVLPDVLRRHGYSTMAISANPWIHEVNGFNVGFERFHSIRGPKRAPWGAGVRARVRWAIDAWRSTADDGARDAFELLTAMMDEATQPFFWFVNLMECHSPYLPPRPYNDLSGPDRIRAAADAARYQTPAGFYRICVGEIDPPADALRRMRHLYARSIRQMDDWLGRVLTELDRRRMLDDTLVVITSDHGENLGENHLMGHVLSVDDRLIRVPLVFAGADPPRLEPLMSLTELPALLATCLGFADHPWIDDVRPSGLAVSQIAAQILLPDREALVRGWGVPEEAIKRMASPMTCATDGRFKLVHDGSTEQYFDLAQDPLEEHPAKEESIDPQLRRRLRAAVSTADEARPAFEVAKGPADAVALDEAAELEERLRTLGYI